MLTLPRKNPPKQGSEFWLRKKDCVQNIVSYRIEYVLAYLYVLICIWSKIVQSIQIWYKSQCVCVSVCVHECVPWVFVCHQIQWVCMWVFVCVWESVCVHVCVCAECLCSTAEQSTSAVSVTQAVSIQALTTPSGHSQGTCQSHKSYFSPAHQGPLSLSLFHSLCCI